MFELNSGAQPVGGQASQANKQNLRLLIALSLLLVALTVVLVKDRDFWFGSNEAVQSAPATLDNTAKTNSSTAPAQTSNSPVARAATKNHLAPKANTQQAVSEPSSQDAVSPVVASNRVVLPPLDVEVVAGDKHSAVHPGSNVKKVEILDSNRASAVTASMPNLPTSAAQRERLSRVAAPELRQTLETPYPVLGQHSKVQGSVVLQAVVGADGMIENLSVLSGPAILVTAAQQAVREWRFKPYLLNGQPVETKTRITVNFSIRVSDNNPANAS